MRIEVDERKKNKTVYFNFMHGLSFRNECSGGRCIYGVSCR